MFNPESLFSAAAPLAARMRPTSVDEIVGQTGLLLEGSPLRELARSVSDPSKASRVSVILWGPPGTGKTTIAQVIARISGRKFVELSAITAGVKDVRDVMLAAKRDREVYGASTLLFLDEIHRFSKAQQDALLPGVENGSVTLIAATTENPSFSVIGPLLSRSLLLTLRSLEAKDIETLLNRALSADHGLANAFSITPEAAEQIVLMADGDARRALTVLDAAASHAASSDSSAIEVENVSAAMDRALVRYDRQGDQHYDVISAFIKSVRGSDADAAIHYLARMIEAGEDPRFIARRLIILAAEDIGLADPQALTIATAAADAVGMIGMPEGRIPLAEATIYLALAAKSNSAYNAINAAIADVQAGMSGPIPKALRSSNFSGAKAQGAGVGYVYPHDDSRAVVEQSYLSGKTANRRYYLPKEVGSERLLVERWNKLREIIRAKKSL
jgi:putative ATPase